MQFEVATGRTDLPHSENKSYFFWGLTPDMRIDAQEICRHGVSAIREQTTVENGLASLSTLGIWSPRETTYFCLKEETKP